MGASFSGKKLQPTLSLNSLRLWAGRMCGLLLYPRFHESRLQLLSFEDNKCTIRRECLQCSSAAPACCAAGPRCSRYRPPNTVCLALRRMGRIDHMKALSDSLTSCSFKAFETDNNYNLLHKKLGRTFAASVGASERCGLSGKGKCWSFYDET